MTLNELQRDPDFRSDDLQYSYSEHLGNRFARDSWKYPKHCRITIFGLEMFHPNSPSDKDHGYYLDYIFSNEELEANDWHCWSS